MPERLSWPVPVLLTLPLPVTVPLTVAEKLLPTEMVEEDDADRVTPLLPKVSAPPIKSVPPPSVIEAVSEMTLAADVEKVPVPVML